MNKSVTFSCGARALQKVLEQPNVLDRAIETRRRRRPTPEGRDN